MPELTAILTALLLERPLCLDCIVAKTGAAPGEVERTLARVRGVIAVRDGATDRCHACGEVRMVVSIERPAP